MRNALIAAVVAAAVASGSAMATSLTAGRTARPHPLPPRHPAPRSPHGAQRPLSKAAIQAMITAWSAAHPGWKNPAEMTRAEMVRAATAHPAVYASDLNRSSLALRTVQQYGAYATMPPSLRALERAHGIPIPAGIPYVPLRELVSGQMLARLKAAGVRTH